MFGRLALYTIISTYALTFSASAQMSQNQAISEVERQLNAWKAEGRNEDIKIISTHSTLLKKQVKAGHVDLQAIVDTHNYTHKDGKYYGQSPSKTKATIQTNTKPRIVSKRTIINGQSIVSESNKPVAAFTRLEQSFKGFPAKLTYTAQIGFTFPNGNFVSCANWDPAILDPTAESVGRAVKGCDVTKTRGEGKRANAFSKGQTIDVKFGNVSANGFDWGRTSSSQISGSNLLMTKSGQIAIGKFRGTSVSSGGDGVGVSSRSRPLVGTYVLDGHIITITGNAGEIVNGFIAWTSNSGSQKIDHIYLNGEHFWNRKA